MLTSWSKSQLPAELQEGLQVHPICAVRSGQPWGFLNSLLLSKAGSAPGGVRSLNVSSSALAEPTMDVVGTPGAPC